jgi:outer membrane lipoprotein-sorting protein
MRYVLLTVLAPVFAAQGNGAENLFRAMEKKIDAAKSLRVASLIYVKDNRGGGKLKLNLKRSTLALAPGNKVRMTMKGEGGGKEMEMEVVSDGEKLALRNIPPGQDKQEAAPKNLHALMGKMMSRTGSLGAFSLLRDPPNARDPDKLVTVSDFKAGADGKVNGRDVKMLEYRVKVAGKQPAKVTLWLDAKTLLPYKRLVVPEKDRENTRIWETYIEFTIDPRLDPKTFALQK